MQMRPEYVHNDYLNTLADYGFAGFALIAAAMAVFWLGVVRIWRYVRRSNDLGSRQSTRAAIVLGACSGLLAMMLHCIVEFNMHIPALAIVAVTIMAIVTAQWRFATERFWVRPGVLGRIVGSLACAALACWLGFNAVKTFREQRLVARAEKTRDPGAYQALFAQAFAIDPKNSNTAYEVGASLRTQSWNGAGDYQKQAERAIEWFKKSAALDPYTPHPFVGIGMCLDFLDRKREAWPYFRHALILDPNNYWVLATYGWHLEQFEAWNAAAKKLWLSICVKPKNNPMAFSYYEIALRKQQELKQPPQISQPAAPENPAKAEAASAEPPK
jgi:tetratricopeptide (TPR) repeat protein